MILHNFYPNNFIVTNVIFLFQTLPAPNFMGNALFLLMIKIFSKKLDSNFLSEISYTDFVID